MAVYIRSKNQVSPSGTEFEVLKASHKFLRDDSEHPTSWNDQLAAKYYSNLFREFAVCDLKHYKSGNFALRWRTESEVLSGAGETSCANTRCEHHSPLANPGQNDSSSTPAGALTTLELPFAYQEHSELKSALVKVVLCPRCYKKLMWKHNKEKEKQEAESNKSLDQREREPGSSQDLARYDDDDLHPSRRERSRRKSHRESPEGASEQRARRHRSSRSRSPRRDESRTSQSTSARRSS